MPLLGVVALDKGTPFSARHALIKGMPEVLKVIYWVAGLITDPRLLSLKTRAVKIGRHIGASIYSADGQDADSDGYMVCESDCNDSDATINPGATELCDAIDNNCSSGIDETCACVHGDTQSCYTGPGGTNGVGICSSGTQTCDAGVWTSCSGDQVPIEEAGLLCSNILDDDCDGLIDSADPECASVCGNLILEAGEECEDGNTDNTDACVNCVSAVCGDGYVQSGVEACDDGNAIETDGCTSSCEAGWSDGSACTSNSDCLND